MKAEGIADVNPSHPKLVALLATGATVDEIAGAARSASQRKKGFAYALGILERQRTEAAAMANGLHQGALPSTRAERKSFAQQDREAGWARWEEMTGRTHPDRIAAQPITVEMERANVVAIEGH